jgi:xanthine dehydrogenase accessory factor
MGRVSSFSTLAIMEDIRIYEEIIRLKTKGEPAVLVAIVGSSGSTPRRAGAKMLVRGDGSTLGTIGGGKVEASMTVRAGDVLLDGSPRMETFTLDEEQGMVCGGELRVYLEPLHPVPTLVVIGKGHVGRALAEMAGPVGFRVIALDPPESSGTAPDERLPAELEKCAGSEASIVIAAPGHHQDFSAARAALKTAAPFVGVIGSRRKKSALLDYLREQGFPEEDLERIVTPVGLDIGARSPAEIAVSILAQLIERRSSRAENGIRNSAVRRPIEPHGEKQAASSPR